MKDGNCITMVIIIFFCNVLIAHDLVGQPNPAAHDTEVAMPRSVNDDCHIIISISFMLATRNEISHCGYCEI